MYGEKAEEVEELRLDIQDVKSMYRQQVLLSTGVECLCTEECVGKDVWFYGAN